LSASASGKHIYRWKEHKEEKGEGENAKVWVRKVAH
jgi:hypothetical protein